MFLNVCDCLQLPADKGNKAFAIQAAPNLPAGFSNVILRRKMYSWSHQ